VSGRFLKRHGSHVQHNGRWREAQLRRRLRGKVTIGMDGKVKADLSGMKPVVFSTQVGATPVKGDISYQGTTDGAVDLSATAAPNAPAAVTTLPSGGSAPSSSAATPSGTAGEADKAWRPTGTVNVADLLITVKLTQPAAITVLNNVTVSQVTGSQTSQAGDAVDLQPLLRRARAGATARARWSSRPRPPVPDPP
jgi:hypothetical protein